MVSSVSFGYEDKLAYSEFLQEGLSPFCNM